MQIQLCICKSGVMLLMPSAFPFFKFVIAILLLFPLSILRIQILLPLQILWDWLAVPYSDSVPSNHFFFPEAPLEGLVRGEGY